MLPLWEHSVAHADSVMGAHNGAVMLRNVARAVDTWAGGVVFARMHARAVPLSPFSTWQLREPVPYGDPSCQRNVAQQWPEIKSATLAERCGIFGFMVYGINGAIRCLSQISAMPRDFSAAAVFSAVASLVLVLGHIGAQNSHALAQCEPIHGRAQCELKILGR